MRKSLVVVMAAAICVTVLLGGGAVWGQLEEKQEPKEPKKVKMPEIPAPPVQLKALNAFVGDWRSAYEHLPAMFGEPGTGTGEFHCEWVLDNWFVMGKGSSTGSFGTHKSMWMVTYDPKMQTYRSFAFDNYGTCSTATMTHDPETNTWLQTSDGVDFKSGKPAEIKSMMRFVGKDKLEWEWRQKAEGETEFTLMMKGVDTRVPG